MRYTLEMLLACTWVSTACASTSDAKPLHVYKPSEVVAKREALLGRTVKVMGFIVLEDEAHGLWDSAEDRAYVKAEMPDPDDPAWRKCLTAHYSDHGAMGIGRDHPRNLTVVGKIGIVQDRDSIDFGACSEVYIMIEDVVKN